MNTNFLQKIILLLIILYTSSVIAEKSGLAVGSGDDSYNQTDCPNILLTDIACGENHVVGISEEGELIAWGNNRFGQTNCPAGKGYTVITAGAKHSAAIQNGVPVVWGDSSKGQTKCPKNISGLIDISSRIQR